MKWILTMMALSLVACASSVEREAPAGPEPEPQPAPASLRSCLEALGATYPNEIARADAATTVCGKMWSKPACSDAWESSLTLAPGERAPHIMQACSSAYCPELRPAPELCQHDASRADLIDESVDWLNLWALFNRSALADTLGEENALEAAQFSRTLMLLVSMTKGRRNGS